MEELIHGLFFYVFVGGFVVPVVVGLLVPGRKGFLKAEREETYSQASLESIAQLFVERLTFANFETATEGVEHGGAGGEAAGSDEESRPIVKMRMLLRREGDPGEADLVSFDKSPISGELELEQTGPDVRAALTLRFKEWVFLDTGEGAYMERLIDRLMYADLPEEKAPSPRPSFLATYVGMFGFLALAASALRWHPAVEGELLETLAMQTGMLFFGALFLGVAAAGILFWRRSQLTGLRWVGVGVFCAAAAFYVSWSAVDFDRGVFDPLREGEKQAEATEADAR